jgi:hypothetical protein
MLWIWFRVRIGLRNFIKSWESEPGILEGSVFWILPTCEKISVSASVADLDPDLPDPHVFGPPGSGSTSQRYGSGSGSCSGSISQRHGSPDPDPPQNVMDPQHWFLLTLWAMRKCPFTNTGNSLHELAYPWISDQKLPLWIRILLTGFALPFFEVWFKVLSSEMDPPEIRLIL